MKIYTVSDLHLPGGMDKTMDMFGERWQGHWEKIREAWNELVKDDDVVLIAGDISWAMHLRDALDDLKSIGELRGKKILIRGNHDFWWSSVTKVRDALPKGMYVLQNDAMRIGDFVFAGTRGWMDNDSPDDKKIFAREHIRLDLTLAAADRLTDDSTTLIVMLHYPPILNRTKCNEFCEMLEAHNAKYCIYGHLHGVDRCEAEPIYHNGTVYLLSSCDMIDFKLREVL